MRSYVRLDLCLERFARLLNVVQQGFWLGFLDAEDLTALTVRCFEGSAMYHDPEHNQRGLFSWEAEAIERFFRPGSTVLVAGAGGGRELMGLYGLGFQADGFDCAAGLVEACRRLIGSLGIPSKVELCAPNEVPSGLGRYDGLVIGWSAYMHIPGSARRIAFLRKMRDRALPSAPILLSFWVRAGECRDDARALQLASWLRRLRRQRREFLEPGDHVTRRGYCHRFTQEELETELKAAGFRLAHYSSAGEPHAVGMAE